MLTGRVQIPYQIPSTNNYDTENNGFGLVARAVRLHFTHSALASLALLVKRKSALSTRLEVVKAYSVVLLLPFSLSFVWLAPQSMFPNQFSRLSSSDLFYFILPFRIMSVPTPPLSRCVKLWKFDSFLFFLKFCFKSQETARAMGKRAGKTNTERVLKAKRSGLFRMMWVGNLWVRSLSPRVENVWLRTPQVGNLVWHGQVATRSRCPEVRSRNTLLM